MQTYNVQFEVASEFLIFPTEKALGFLHCKLAWSSGFSSKPVFLKTGSMTN